MLVMERGAATHFAVLIDGGFGPQPHPNFIEVFGNAALDDGNRTVERAGKNQKVRCPSHA
jgi:hypothetical protein